MALLFSSSFVTMVLLQGAAGFVATTGPRRGVRSSLSQVSSSSSAVDIVEAFDARFAQVARRCLVGSVVAVLDLNREVLLKGNNNDLNLAAQRLVALADKRLSDLLTRATIVAPSCVDSDLPGFERRALVFARLAAFYNWGHKKVDFLRPIDHWGDDDDQRRVSGGKGEIQLPLRAAADLKASTPDDAVDALTAYLLEKYDVPQALRRALWYTDEDARHDDDDDFAYPSNDDDDGDVSTNETSSQLTVETATMQVAYKFSAAYAEAASGRRNVRDALRHCVGLTVSKKAAKEFVESGPKKYRSPLGAVRRAQIRALGGEAWVGDAVARAPRVGSSLSSDEAFLTNDAFPWIVKNCDEIETEFYPLGLAADFFDEMRRGDPHYSCAGRTAKTVSSAIDAYASSTVSFADDEAFLPNPRGIRPMFLENACVTKNTTVHVPYDDGFYGGYGPYHLGPGTGRADDPDAVLRVEEILSLKRLIYEGQQLDNCLEDRRSSQLKYVMRARQRSSSFWSFTLKSKDKLNHLLLLEVWHLRHGNIVRQAEGPRPRTLPSPEAWHWMRHWCKQNNVDASTWDVYSRLDHIYPCDPL